MNYELRCRECGKTWGNQPRSICDDCFSPLEVQYDYAAIQITREQIAQRAPNMWRYAELLPLPADFHAKLPVGFTPLLSATQLGERIGAGRLCIKNDAVCLPTLSFKDRVVAVALAQARSFGLDTVACSSTGNLANAVAAQAAREGFKSWIFIPADLEPAKVLGTQVFGAQLVRIAGSYDQVNRLCSQIADERQWGFVNVNLRPYYAEGSKTVGYEIAEQLGWRLPDNIVCPMAGGSLITKIKKAFDELVKLGLVEEKKVRFFGAQATGCSPISTAVKTGAAEITPQKPSTIARSLAIGNPADGHYAIKAITATGGWSEDVSDGEIVDAIQLLAETEGIFTETAGGVTIGVTRKLYEQGRISPNEVTVACITGNGLKTTDALRGAYETPEPIPAKIVEFENFWQRTLSEHPEIQEPVEA
ncbi:MAG TPA: threonine synthase [Terriglobales bacterium]|jgi:threonine synthase|nr:threonine synthase [Terriglobales bacterium]